MGCGSSTGTDGGGSSGLYKRQSTFNLRPEANVEDHKISGKHFVIQSSGKIKDTYKIMNVIGKGAFGEIVACLHKPTKQRRAIKVLYKSGGEKTAEEALAAALSGEEIQDTMDIEELKNEIEMMRSLDHVNILKLFEFFEDEKRYYLAMEVCTGGTVMDLVHAGASDEHEIALIMRQVLSCVNYIHANKVLHRDLKPENILLVEKGTFHNLKIIDFGLATKLEDGQILETPCGTPNFMGPEVFKGKYSYPADIWACGIIAFMLFVHKVPFLVMTVERKEEMLEMVEKGFDMSDPDMEKLSDEAKDFLSKLCNPNSDKRLTAAEALKHPLLAKLPSKLRQTKSTNKLLANLTEMSEMNALAQATHAYIASQLVSQSEHDKLIKIFQSLDSGEVGVLHLDTFKKSYKEHLGITYDEATTVALFHRLDADKSGAIDYSEFVAAMVAQNFSTVTEKLKQVFKAFDLDGDGTIDLKEITQILSFGSKTRVNHKILDVIMAQMDLDGDGTLTMKEFVDALASEFSTKSEAICLPS